MKSAITRSGAHPRSGLMFRRVIAALLFAPLAAMCVQAQEAQPLSLSEAVSMAIEQNRQLRAARFDEDAANTSTWEAKSAYLPSIDWESTYSKSESDRYKFDTSSLPPGTGGDSFQKFGFTGANYTNKFVLQQLIFDYSVIGRIKLTDLQAQASEWQTTGQEQTAAADAVMAYLDVLRAQELLAVQKQRLQLAEEQLDTAKAAFDVGMRIRTDVLRAELTRSSAMRDVTSAEITVDRALSVLNRVIGAPLRSRFTVASGGLADFDPPQTVIERLDEIDALYSTAEEKNPSIQVASLLVAQSQEQINIARGEFLPQASLGASWGFNESGDPRFKDQEWTLRGVITIPLFEGGRRVAKMRRTREQLSAEEQRYDDAVRTVQNMVEQTALSLEEEQRNLEIAEESASVAKENHERFQNLYKEGMADSLDVTQSITELVEAENNVVTTRYGYLKLYAQLLEGLGAIPVTGDQYDEGAWLMTLPSD